MRDSGAQDARLPTEPARAKQYHPPSARDRGRGIAHHGTPASGGRCRKAYELALKSHGKCTDWPRNIVEKCTNRLLYLVEKCMEKCAEWLQYPVEKCVECDCLFSGGVFSCCCGAPGPVVGRLSCAPGMALLYWRQGGERYRAVRIPWIGEGDFNVLVPGELQVPGQHTALGEILLMYKERR